MKEQIAKQWIKSAAAVVCVASISVSMLTISNKVADSIKNSVVAVSGGESQGTAAGTDDNGTSEIITDAAVTDAATSGDSTDTVTDASQNGATAAGSVKTTVAAGKTTIKTANGMPSTNAEIINYCNTALNAVKSSKAGYTKKYVMKANGSTSGVPSVITKLITKNKTTTMSKGSDSTDDFPAAGFSWSSKLRVQDVAKAEIKQNGQYYEITLRLGKEKNPAKGEASSYGRVMSVIDAKDASDMLSGIKSVTMTYHDGYVYAKINSKTGKLVSAELSASADVAASISILGDIAINDIVSTETYTNFVW